MKTLSIFFILFIATPLWARNSFIESLNKKAEFKKKTRWTLADWLDTKRQVGIMDAWLAANSSTQTFEFYLRGSYSIYKNQESGNSPQENTVTTYSLAGFVSILGLSFQQEIDENLTRTKGELILRILGKAEQSTRWNLFYGFEKINEKGVENVYEIPYYGTSLRVYLLNFLAIQAKYGQLQKTLVQEEFYRMGYAIEYGLALDIGALQLTVEWFNRKSEYSLNNTSIDKGMRYGLYLYF